MRERETHARSDHPLPIDTSSAHTGTGAIVVVNLLRVVKPVRIMFPSQETTYADSKYVANILTSMASGEPATPNSSVSLLFLLLLLFEL